MASQGISESLRAFIREHIQSVEQMEVLLLLYSTTPKEWSAVRVARELRIDAMSASRRLADFAERGLISARAGDEALLYWYEGSSPNNDRAIAELDRANRERRTTLIGVIFSTPSDDVRAFADAFRLRRSTEE
ncbi:MAG TPA: hypothetical protein VHB25_21670 [Gemmatimonadaceae bacterium]|nr:hypothetical protein [Gemmatimonadaceae bacterium]